MKRSGRHSSRTKGDKQMRTVLVLLDSLNRSALECYGGKTVHTPNISRFADRAVTFDNHFVGSLPCIPARRDFHTGRINFLHRSWGPLEPFDDSFPELLRTAGIYTHLATDHHHYFADGGATYHQRYSSWDLVRGQAVDRWKAIVNPDVETLQAKHHPLQQARTNYLINREFIVSEEDYCGPQVFSKGLDFLADNHEADSWYLQLECFDPHEPFHAPPRFREMYPTDYDGPILDWPKYAPVQESVEEIAELKANYAALTTMCDEYFGRLLDTFDKLNLWDNTCLILTTDHGFLLGEHDWWAKNRMPVYDEIARIPLLIYHPDFKEAGGTRRKSLSQSMDLMPTVLEAFDQPIPDDVLGKSLFPVMQDDQTIRDAVIFGYFGAACNVSDGRFVYHRYPAEMSAEGLYEYTLMPTRMTSRFSINDLTNATLADPFSFTKGVPVLRLKPQSNSQGEVIGVQGSEYADAETRLYDLSIDPSQQSPISDPETEARMLSTMIELMKQADAPDELYQRLQLN